MHVSIETTPLYAGYLQVYKDGFMVENCVAACDICGWAEYFCVDQNGRLLLTEADELVIKREYGKINYYISNDAPKKIMDSFTKDMSKNKTCNCGEKYENTVAV